MTALLFLHRTQEKREHSQLLHTKAGILACASSVSSSRVGFRNIGARVEAARGPSLGFLGPQLSWLAKHISGFLAALDGSTTRLSLTSPFIRSYIVI
jgi:hypothetical protein